MSLATDHSVDPEDLHAVETYLRLRIASPLKSWFSPKEIAPVFDLTPMQAGACIAALSKDPPADLELEKRPGGRGGAKWCIRRVQSETPERRWWIERGERIQVGGRR